MCFIFKVKESKIFPSVAQEIHRPNFEGELGMRRNVDDNKTSIKLGGESMQIRIVVGRES